MFGTLAGWRPSSEDQTALNNPPDHARVHQDGIKQITGLYVHRAKFHGHVVEAEIFCGPAGG